jgi:AcrR family transcriptional regulator
MGGVVEYFSSYLGQRAGKRPFRITAAQRRDQLVHAAIAAINTHGIDTSVEQMAAEAGVTKPIIYRHFKDKAGLVEAIERHYETDLTRRLASSLSSHPPNSPSNVKALLYRTIRTYLDFVAENLQVYRYLTRQPLRERNIDSSEITRRLAQQVGDYLAGALREASLKEAPAYLWAHLIVGGVHLAADWWVDHQEIPLGRASEYLSQLLWAGLKGVVSEAIDKGPQARQPARKQGSSGRSR